MGQTEATTSVTFFFITDARSTDRTAPPTHTQLPASLTQSSTHPTLSLR